MTKLENKYRKKIQFTEPPEIGPLEVKVEGNFEEAIRKFRALFQKERIVGQLKEREAYEKPSEKKRRKRREAVERRLMMEARERMMRTGEWERRQKKKQKKKEQKMEDKIKKQERTLDIEDYDE